MKVVALVLLVAVVGLFMAGAVDAKHHCCKEEKTAIAGAAADACANGQDFALAITSTDTFANTQCHGAVAGSSASSLSIAS